jgi:two-component system sensor histidine kinase KdpD
VSPTLALDERDRTELVETIGVEASRLDRLVGDLLDLSRLQAGVAVPQPALWAVEGLVAIAQEGAADDRVLVEATDGLPPVNVDAGQIRQALANVLDNARRVSPAGTTVRVTAETTGREVLLRIADEGPGLADAELERVFEPFQRGTAAAAYRGSGLGLAIARGLVEANGGRIWAERSASGAVIALALPAAGEESC